MSFKAIFYAYVLGGLTLVPLLLCALVAYAAYTSEPVSIDLKEKSTTATEEIHDGQDVLDVQDIPKTRKGWLTVRRTFEQSTFDGGYVTLVRSFLDARSKDPKRSRPKDMWYVALKGQILYLYEDESMTDCEAAIQLGSHDVVVYPEGLLDGELFTKRNSICLKPKLDSKGMPSLTREMKLNESEEGEKTKEGDKARKIVESAAQALAKEQALNYRTPWFIFVRSTVEMEDWYLALVHASQHPAQTPTLDALQDVFSPSDMNILVSTLDEQPDIIPMRWFNALFGRIFYSFYKTQHLESFIIGRLMKKLTKVKRPAFLNDILVTEVSVGNRTPVFSKPMLKELTKEGDASMEVHVAFKGEVRITVQATATINLGARFKPYLVKLVLAAVLRELEGNLLIKVKRPPSNRIWYAFTQTPKMVLNVEPVVSDRQITWNMILSTIESSLKTIIQESIVMPNMDDIAFFDTFRREGMNRGGVWADAARKHSDSVTTNEDQRVASDAGPTQEPLLSDGELNSIDPLPQPIQKTSSLQESSSTPEPPLLATSVRGDNMDVDDSSDNVETEPRGRTLDVDTTKATALRSQSTPNSESVLEKGNGQETSVAIPPAKPRSASQTSSVTGNDAVLDNTRSHQTSDSASLSVPAPTSNTPPSPTNFLTTLKSRAADKQALSNTAKETMRKWGMKWGGLNKNLSGSSHEDVPDHDTMGEGLGLTHSRSQTISSMGNSSSGSQKGRASYAEVRAAVAERRERAEYGKEHSPSRSLTPSFASNPIAIPSNKNLPSQNAEYSDHASNSSSTSSTKSSTAVTEAKVSSRSHINSDVPVDEAAPVHAPIHVQPQAKTMSIPGIHASHRGEVMSLGYVPPSVQGDKAKDKERTSSLSKNPKIQSMYRLWKQIASNKSNSELSEDVAGSSTSPMDSVSTTSNGDSFQPDTNATTSAPVLPASMSSLSKRVPPPPLPPRPSPVTISPSPLNQSLQSTSSSAQDVLKEIATKDDHTRKRASLTLSSTPPSPTLGRRVSTTSGARSPSLAQADDLLILDDPAAGSETSKADTGTGDVFVNLPSEEDATRAWGLDLDNEDIVSEGSLETEP
ncbi:hypothetical protein DFH05DRAFT_1386595 [Lentinula detonsa]|uniref:SMP-LTD domain-containing protein n=1 Tax=Lentinula detonsa TaxID=2804962 RepID=A0A9W8PBX2_9AGAR|nr:hypothetical protein DFH05DRAFT_1386595 [Lentinula detonsa]